MGTADEASHAFMRRIPDRVKIAVPASDICSSIALVLVYQTCKFIYRS
jgi:hypothetical protein